MVVHSFHLKAWPFRSPIADTQSISSRRNLPIRRSGRGWKVLFLFLFRLELLDVPNMEMFPQEKDEPYDSIGYVPGRMIEYGNREAFPLRDAEDGEQIDQKELIEPDVARGRGDGDADVQKRANEGYVSDVGADAEGEGDDIQGHAHGKPD